MEINLGGERIVELQSPFLPADFEEKTLARRVDAFGAVAKLLQRPKPEDIQITTVQRRLEPFWYAVAMGRYVYDRRQIYQVQAGAEVQSVSVYDHEHPVATEGAHTFALEVVEHCVEEMRQELILDAQRGQEVDMRKYLEFPAEVVTDLGALSADGTLVVVPEVRGSFVVRKLIALLMKTFQADLICEELIDVEQVTLFYRPVYAIEYLWVPKQKRHVLEFDGLTGAFRAQGGEIKRQVQRVLENDLLFDIGADVLDTFLPGGSIAVKLGREAARKVVH